MNANATEAGRGVMCVLEVEEKRADAQQLRRGSIPAKR
jgi:hypothetical protein